MAEPIWQKNLRDSIMLHPLLLLHGNVKDVFLPSIPGSEMPPAAHEVPCQRFDTWLALEFSRLGFHIIVLYDPVDGIVALRGNMAAEFTKLASSAYLPNAKGDNASSTSSSELKGPERQATALPRTPIPLPKADLQSSAIAKDTWLQRLDVQQKPYDFFRTLYENVLPRPDVSVAVICRFTDRFLAFTDRQDADEKQLSLVIQKAAMAIPAQLSGERINSRLALIFNVEGEIPQELNSYLPFSHSIHIPTPTLEEREQFFKDHHGLFDNSDPGGRFDPSNAEALRLVANLSDGLAMQDLLSLVSLSKREGLGLGGSEVKELLDRFRFGTRENAWLKIKPEALKNAKQILAERVKGQDEVIEQVVPVLIRAKLGMSDISSSQYSLKPRGAFFFVGPTGVGKTELSKAIAELIFGDEKALIRFDMSEYSEEHQQARLVGAPPGYVGFDQGGQLTNAIMEKPFSVVLFDEIEKAHGRILDKFLQVLDDGRLTDGMGRTVYFSESILIFTSNIGTAPKANGPSFDATGVALSPAKQTVEDVYASLGTLTYDALCDHFRKQVKDFFVNTLGRPEILNRIGEDNILVFNFLKNEDAKNKIVDQQIDSLRAVLRGKHQVDLFCTKGFRRLLMTHPNGFDRNGARGVRNLLNKLVMNPLAEQLFLEPERCHHKTFKADYRMALERIGTQPFDRSALAYEWVTE